MPSVQSKHLNQPLTNFALSWPVPGFIADLIFPVMPVAKASDIFYKIDDARQMLKEVDDRRAKSAVANLVDWASGTDTFSTQEHALSTFLDDNELDNADVALQPRMNATKQVLTRLQMNKEIEAATVIEAISTTNKANAVKKWTDPTSDPVAETEVRKSAMLNAVGKKPNVGFMDDAVFVALVNNPAIVERVKYVQVASQANIANIIAGAMGLERLIVSQARKNTSRTATPTMVPVWGKGFHLAYIDPVVSLQSLSLGWTFQWKAGGTNGYAVNEYREDRAHGTFMEATRWYDQKIVAGACYALVDAVIA